MPKTRQTKPLTTNLALNTVLLLIVILIAGYAGGFMNNTCAGIIIFLILIFGGVFIFQLRKGKKTSGAVTPAAVSASAPVKASVLPLPEMQFSGGKYTLTRPADYQYHQSGWQTRYSAEEWELMQQVDKFEISEAYLSYFSAGGEKLREVDLASVASYSPAMPGHMRDTLYLAIDGKWSGFSYLPPWAAQREHEIRAVIVKYCAMEEQEQEEEFRGETVRVKHYVKKNKK